MSINCITPNRYVWFAAIDKSNSDPFSDPVADHCLDLASENHKELAARLRETADYIEQHTSHSIEINSSN